MEAIPRLRFPLPRCIYIYIKLSHTKEHIQKLLEILPLTCLGFQPPFRVSAASPRLKSIGFLPGLSCLHPPNRKMDVQK